MKKALILLLVIAAGLFLYFKFSGEDHPEGPKQQPLTVGKHSSSFNNSIDSLVMHYLDLKDAFAASDSFKAKQSATSFIAFIQAMRLDELKKDTTGIYESAASFLNDVKTNAESLGQSQVMTDMRQDFKNIGENLYPFLKTIHYEGRKLYWQHCEKAFGDGNSANWISRENDAANPYLGSAVTNCSDIQDTIKSN